MLDAGCHEDVTIPSRPPRNEAGWRTQRAMSGVSAAPNRARISGRVAHVEPSATSANKWYLTVEVASATAIEGGLFAHPGDVARVFAFGDAPPLEAGGSISAEVEYIGGPTGGEFQLIRLMDEQADAPVTGDA
jgi:hypothetical protein